MGLINNNKTFIITIPVNSINITYTRTALKYRISFRFDKRESLEGQE